MGLDSVSKIRVICHSHRREELLEALESFGRIHLVRLDEYEEEGFRDYLKPAGLDTAELEEKVASLEKAIQFLEEEAETDLPVSRRESVTEAQLLKLLDDERLLEDARRAWMIAVRKAKLEGAEKELLAEEKFLRQWKELTLPLEDLERSSTCTLKAGILEKDSIQQAHRLEEESPLLHLEVVSAEKNLERVVAAVHETSDEEVLKSLTELGFTGQDFGSRTGTVKENLVEVRRELKIIRGRMEALHRRAVEYAEEFQRFRNLSDAAGLVLKRMKATEAGYSSRSAFVFKAWIRENDLEVFNSRIEALGAVSLDVIEPEEGETPPSPITESPAVEPYTMLTEMYGKPTREDPDPTPLMAPFYALFFGICIGDAGYGLAMAAGSALGWYIVRKRHGNPNLFKLLFQGGLASVLVGVFLGGWFGIPFHRLPGFLQAPADILNSLVPGYQPGQPGQEGFAISKQFLYLTLALGLVQLTAGIVINLVKRWKAGEKLAAVLDQSGWLLATAGLFPWLFNRYLLSGSLYDAQGPLDRVFLYMLAAGAVLIFVMGGRKAKGFGKVGMGAYAAYGIVNLLGDVLSYSRLFALALSSAIIAQVINQMAGMVMQQLRVPVLSLLIATLVVVGGHVFNLGMAALSGFIHTARLQFVEFFGKFYDGTGVPFQPLRYEPRYVNIERNEQ